ncbi:FAD:protein FMN transferase [Pontibacter sp. CAU 1760]
MRFALFCLLLAFTPFLYRQQAATPFHIRGFAQGTTYQVSYYAADSLVSKAEIDFVLAQLDSSLSLYKPYSLISQFNRSEKGLRVDKHLKQVVRRAKQVSAQTNGAFDITVQPLVQAWGFSASPTTALPDSATVQALLSCVGDEKIALRGAFLTKASPCVRIDVNGIAQGYTVDVLAHLLEQRGIRNYLVEVGGEVRVKGRKQPDGKLMTIGIEGPATTTLSEDTYPIQRLMSLPEGAVTTSGNYRKFFQHGGRKVSHLINPKTGYPLENELISVTVWAADAMTADAYDNALMGMGLTEALQFVQKRKALEAYFIYHRPDGSVADTATSGFFKFTPFPSTHAN